MRSILKPIAEIWDDPNPNPQSITKEEQDEIQLKACRNGALINAFVLALFWAAAFVWPVLQDSSLIVFSVLPVMTLASYVFRYVRLRNRLES